MAKQPRKNTGELTNPHDKFFKEIFGQPDLAADFVRNYLPSAIVNALDLDALEVQKESFVDEKLEENFADLIYRVRLRNSQQTAFVCLLFEHKSNPDKWAALQILTYLLQFWERLKANKAKTLPLIFPVLFYHGEARWNYSASFTALLDQRHLTEDTRREWQLYIPNFSYFLCDLSALDETEIRGHAIVRATLLMMKNIHRLHEAPHLLNVWQAFGKLENQSAVQYIRVMLKYASEANTTLTKGEILDSIEQSFTKRGEKIMAPFVEEFRQEGIEIGIQKGLQQGLKQGITDMTLRQLERKVGGLTLTQKKTITKLPIPKLIQLSEDLLDFQAAEDLKRWLRQNAA
jgi:predicted transposase/invertase (TIGR01784 family)